MLSTIGFMVLFLNLGVGLLAANPVDCTVKASLPCLRYKKVGLEDCSPVRLQQEFPSLYYKTAQFTGSAGSFDIGDLGYRWWGTYGQYMYINLTFTPPQSAAKNYVRGFEISQLKTSDPKNPTCYIFDMSNATWDPDSAEEYDLLNSLYLWPLANGTEYFFELYTLPKPDVLRDPNNYLSQRYYIPENPPSDWVATINVMPVDSERRVTVSFSPAPDVYKMTHYVVQLMNISLDGKEAQHQAQKVSRDKTAVNFTNVEPGNYSVWVMPDDPYWHDINRCLCTKSSIECRRCTTTITQMFEMEYIPKTSPTTPTPTTSTTTVTPAAAAGTEEPDPPATTLKIAFAIVGSLIGIAIVVVFVLFWMRRQRQQLKGDEKGPDTDDGMDANRNKIERFDVDSVVTVEQLRKPNNIKICQMKTLGKTPKLFLLFEEDHEYHKKVVDMFATYLQTHCHCSVMCAEWQLDSPWVHQEMQSADYRVVINSQGSYMTYLASKQKKVPQTQASINSIHNSFLRDERYDRTVMVYFDYTSEQFIIPDICPGYKYKILKNFPEFLMHIHKIDRTDNLRQYDLPLDGNHNKRPIGQKLLDAIAQASRYEKENPNMYMKRFGFLRSTSLLSEESQFDSGLPEDTVSPSATPVSEKDNPLSGPTDLQEYLGDLDMITLSPTVLEALCKGPSMQPKKLKPLKIVTNNHVTKTPTPPTGSTGVSDFEFIPPEDMDDDFDIKSKTLSEQLGNINDHYTFRTELAMVAEQTGYNRNSDLQLLQLHNPDLVFTADVTEDSISLGGLSV